MASTHKHIRSGTANKRPTTAIAEGQIALATNIASPGLFFKDSTGATIVKIGPVHVGATAPNASPAGSAGNSIGEVWLDTSLTPIGVKIYDGTAFVNATPIGSTTVQGLLELATNAETQSGSDTARAVSSAGLQSKLSDSTSTTSSTTIASSTAVKAAYDLADAALPKSGGTVTGNLEIGTTGSLTFEGATADAFETTIAVVDPTADRTITLPNTTGTVVTTGDSGTVTSTMLLDGTILNEDINASAAIAYSKLATLTSANIILGSSANVATSTAVTGDVTISNTGVTAISSGAIVNADVNASAAIAGTKIAPDFGAQNITTTGSSTAATFNPTGTTPSVTGIYSPGANRLGITTNSVERVEFGTSEVVFNDDAADYDFRIEGDTNTNLFFADASAEAVGIRTATPVSELNVSVGNGGNITISNTNDTHSAGLAFGDTTSNSAGRISYDHNTNALAISTNGTGRLFIDSAGKIGVGGASVAGLLQLKYATDVHTSFRNATAGGLSAGTLIESVNDAFNSYNPIYLKGSQFTFGTDSAGSFVERLRITSTGTVNIVGAGTAGSTQAVSFNGSAPVNSLVMTSGGLVGLGTSSPDGKLTIQSSGNSTFVTNWKNSSGTNIGYFYQDGSGNGAFYVNDSAAAQKVLLNSNGVSYFTGGNVGIGTTSPTVTLHVNGQQIFNGPATLQSGSVIRGYFGDVDGDTNIQLRSEAQTVFKIGNNEAVRIDASRRLLVGTSTSLHQNSQLQVVSPVAQAATLQYSADNSSGAYLNVRKSRGTAAAPTEVSNNDLLGGIVFQGYDGANYQDGAYLFAEADGTWTDGGDTTDNPTRLVFSTTADGAASPTERMRITQSGLVGINRSSTIFAANEIFTVQGASSYNIDSIVQHLNRTNDGTIVNFYVNGTAQGSISVSGSTVSYNGAHLSRWSQLPGGATREEILRGTVLSNIDEMCGWGDEENEQLNRMKVSDVEGDKNVSGVFQCWDDDDDTYTDDFYCAMTGDFIIRIAEGVTVQRGDLLMSAGDGTAKPQDDDIIRSKTIAKVTSTHVTCTYEDGSYCVPCVLMAC